ncbi:MAG TPA: hypothetical protein VIJ22_10900 [Polyangiaceae bacterium]
MKRLLSAGAVVCSIAASLTGCYWLASYEDLTSGLGNAGADAPSEVVPGFDAQLPVEAGPFCPPDAGPLVYCMDFDGVDAAALGLGVYEADAGIVNGISVSPPSSLFVRLDGQGSEGAYNVSFPFQPTTATLQFDVSIPAAGQWVTLLSIILDQDSTQTGRVLNVVVSPEREFQVQEYFSLSDGGSENYGHTTLPLDGGAAPAAWHHVVLSMTVDDATQRYVSGLTVDGQVLEHDYPLGLSWAQGNAQIGVGVTYGGGAGPELYFDNVRADFGL